MKIIALWETQNTGKTTTLKMVYNELKAQGYTLLLEPDESNRDFYAIFEIDGIKVGLYTGGDNANSLKVPFDKFKEAGCAVCITASRVRDTEKGSVNFIRRQVRNSDIIWHRKAVIYRSNGGRKSNPVTEQQEINKIQADFIIKELQELLKKYKSSL